MRRSDILNEAPTRCDNPGCREPWTVIIETEGRRRWYLCAGHGGEQ